MFHLFTEHGTGYMYVLYICTNYTTVYCKQKNNNSENVVKTNFSFTETKAERQGYVHIQYIIIYNLKRNSTTKIWSVLKLFLTYYK